MKKLQRFIRLSLCLSAISFGVICTAAFAAAAKNVEQPIKITSDEANFDQLGGVATYKGHVIVEQGTRTLRAQKLTLHRDNNKQIKVMVASGKPATFLAQDNKDKPPGSGKADLIKYYPQLNKVDLIGNASLTQNGDTVSGSKLTYNFVTEELQSKSSQQQRTTVILQSKRVP